MPYITIKQPPVYAGVIIGLKPAKPENTEVSSIQSQVCMTKNLSKGLNQR